MKYYRQYVDDKNSEEITKEKAIYMISRNYKPNAAEEILENSSRTSPVRTIFAYYWKE